MPLTKSKGNMYEWVSHTHSHLGGKCSHKCVYCFVQAMAERNPVMRARYGGELCLIERELKVNYGKGKVIFIEHCNDLFAKDVPADYIVKIISHCLQYPDNRYMYQTKNPERFFAFLDLIPKGSILGTTIETNRHIDGISVAPCVANRVDAMARITGFDKFVTIEPVLDFDIDVLARMISEINPTFINLGADSKNRGLPEPTVEKIHNLVYVLRNEYGIELREKHNLKRLK